MEMVDFFFFFFWVLIFGVFYLWSIVVRRERSWTGGYGYLGFQLETVLESVKLMHRRDDPVSLGLGFGIYSDVVTSTRSRRPLFVAAIAVIHSGRNSGGVNALDLM